jgi:hypothetical protein
MKRPVMQELSAGWRIELRDEPDADLMWADACSWKKKRHRTGEIRIFVFSGRALVERNL